MDLAEVLAAEDARWAELHALIAPAPPEQVVLPGYYREGWSAKDLLAHVGAWLAEAGMVLERIAAGTYRHGELDIDEENERTLVAMRDIEFPVVTAQAAAARARMRHVLVELREPSAEADVVDPQGRTGPLRGASPATAGVGRGVAFGLAAGARASARRELVAGVVGLDQAAHDTCRCRSTSAGT